MLKPLVLAPLAVLAALSLAACDAAMPSNEASAMINRVEPENVVQYGDEAPENRFGFMQASEPGLLGVFSSPAELSVASPPATATPKPSDAAQSAGAGAGSNDQIAYSYGYGFRIDSDDINALQNAHVELCNEMGKACRILRSSQARADSYDGYGGLNLQIAADQTGGLTQALEAPAKELGGALVSSIKNGEDLSKQIIDAEARLRSRLVLRDKLIDILRGNRGSVDELVKAESEVAKVNEEIDATRSRLARFRGRIEFSNVEIDYEPAFGETQVGFVRPVASALRSVSSTLGMSLAAIIYALTALAPVAAFLLALRWILHRFGYRLRFWKTDLRENSSERY